jgi:hypothetical protein
VEFHKRTPEGLHLALLAVDKIAKKAREVEFLGGETLQMGPGSDRYARSSGPRDLTLTEWAVRARSITASGGVLDVGQLAHANLWWFRPEGWFYRGSHRIRDTETGKLVPVEPADDQGPLWRSIMFSLANLPWKGGGDKTWEETWRDNRQYNTDGLGTMLLPRGSFYFGLGATPRHEEHRDYPVSVIHVSAETVAADPDHLVARALRRESGQGYR